MFAGLASMITLPHGTDDFTLKRLSWSTHGSVMANHLGTCLTKALPIQRPTLRNWLPTMFPGIFESSVPKETKQRNSSLPGVLISYLFIPVLGFKVTKLSLHSV